MTIPEETLMAFADGELDGEARAAVESAIEKDPQVAARVARHRALRTRIHEAYRAELEEAVPERLLLAARGAAPAPPPIGVDLSARRAREARKPASTPRWQIFTSIAASLAIGIGLGSLLWQSSGSLMTRSSTGALVASGSLARALSRQLASEPAPDSKLQLGLSFLDKSGDYCRTFAIVAEASSQGLACRRGTDWRIVLLAPAVRPSESAADVYRAAGSLLSPVIQSAVQEQILGEPLDAGGEQAARRQDWQARHR